MRIIFVVVVVTGADAVAVITTVASKQSREQICPNCVLKKSNSQFQHPQQQRCGTDMKMKLNPKRVSYYTCDEINS